MKSDKKRYYAQFLISSENKIKTIWNIIKNELGKAFFSGHMPSSFNHGNTEIYPDQAGEASNKYFLTLIDRQSHDCSCRISYLIFKEFISKCFPEYYNNSSYRSGVNNYY